MKERIKQMPTQTKPERYTTRVIEDKVRAWVIDHKKQLARDLIKEKRLQEFKETKAKTMYNEMIALMENGYQEREAWELVQADYLTA